MKKTESLELINKLTKRVEAVGEKAFLAGKFPDVSLVEDIFKAYKHIMNKAWSVTCKSCYFDCFATLYSFTLKNNKTLEEMENKLYELPKGRLLQAFPRGSYDKNMTNSNCTNELAEWHLKNNPGCEKYFSKLPIDWRERCQLAAEAELEEVKAILPTKEIKTTLEVVYPTRKSMFDDLKTLGIKTGATLSTEALQELWIKNKK
jgi:hypothetical protein